MPKRRHQYQEIQHHHRKTTQRANQPKRKRKSHSDAFWLSIIILAVAIIGALLGYFFFPGVLLAPFKALVGAVIGLVGLAMLISVMKNPKTAFNGWEFDITGCLDGCFSFHFVFFISLIGMMSGFLIWHTLLSGVLIGGGFGLVASLLFEGLILTTRKGKMSHSSKS